MHSIGLSENKSNFSINSSYMSLLNSIIPEGVRIKSTDKTREKIFA